MKLILRSNFHDYLDHHFDPMGDYTLRRYTWDGLDRFGQLRFLQSCGLKVPTFGTVSGLLRPPPYGAPERLSNLLSKSCKKLVVYTDEHAHCGEGKLLLELDEAMALHPGALASEYIEGSHGLSWRLLQVGMHGFWIEYKSDDWRSNCGDVEMRVIGQTEGWCGHPNSPKSIICKLPLFAIDFVVGDELYGIDFNVAPGIKGTGVERLLSPKEAVESIKAAYFGGSYLENINRFYTTPIIG